MFWNLVNYSLTELDTEKRLTTLVLLFKDEESRYSVEASLAFQLFERLPKLSTVLNSVLMPEEVEKQLT